MKQGISLDKKSKARLSGAKKATTHSCQWPFPTNQLLKYNPADPPPLSGSNPNPCGRRTHSKQATPTYVDMMTEIGDAPW